uniref:Copper transport protein n=1 Tax=Gasterosteus aculeatus TaxID=69293 RepID=G3Q205_GASAC
MMSMTFGVSSSVTLLFDFWSVHGPAAGMVLSVFVVFLFTIFYEILKVFKLWLGSRSKWTQPQDPYAAHQTFNSASALESSPSESSLTPMEPRPPAPDRRKRWLIHAVQAVLHMMQVSLGYMLMLCVMSYNTWIFLGVIVGSGLGYLISFPLLRII